jgi:hypothetical protein
MAALTLLPLVHLPRSSRPLLPWLSSHLPARSPHPQINSEEWQFFLGGGAVLDRSAQPVNPAPSWCSEGMWDCVTVGQLDLEAK